MELRFDAKFQKMLSLVESKFVAVQPPATVAASSAKDKADKAQQELNDMEQEDKSDDGTADDVQFLKKAIAGRMATPAQKSRAPVKPKVATVAPNSTSRSSGGGVDDDDDDNDPDPLADSGDEVDEDFLRKKLLKLQRKHRGSAVHWLVETRFNEPRNYKECHAWAEAIDAYLREHPGQLTRTLEVMFRRMAGVHLADSTGNWEMCKLLQGDIVDNSLLENQDILSLSKVSKAHANLRPGKAKSFKSKYIDDDDDADGGFNYALGAGSGPAGGGSKGKNKSKNKNKNKTKNAGARTGSASSAAAGADGGAGTQ
jgi:hypothetical protein